MSSFCFVAKYEVWMLDELHHLFFELIDQEEST